MTNDALCLCLFHGAEATAKCFLLITVLLLRYAAAEQARAGHYGLIWILGLLVPLPSFGVFGVSQLSFTLSQRIAVVGAALTPTSPTLPSLALHPALGPFHHLQEGLHPGGP